ncbi:MAG: NfeD family protein [Muribaculaceae bacterium]|nr:NfeD family protein [Muribaculaceae bacterium]MBQ5409718.1 NfeD family protein [Muribaculaceae bacterium]MBQ5509324.1 NfeD family protein [Muribaculaceae bacterium]
MIEYFQNNLWQLWTLVGILCLILELTSGDFFIMCFSIGAFVTAIVAAFVPSFTVQVIVFAVASLLCLLFVRPLALKYFHRKDPDRPSNADAMVGRRGVVTEKIEAGGYGRVKIDGDSWKAQSSISSDINKGTRVEVTAIDSVIITVIPVDEITKE